MGSPLFVCGTCPQSDLPVGMVYIGDSFATRFRTVLPCVMADLTFSQAVDREGRGATQLCYRRAACPMLTGLSFTSGPMCLCEPKTTCCIEARPIIVDIALSTVLSLGVFRIAGQIPKCATVMYSSNG